MVSPIRSVLCTCSRTLSGAPIAGTTKELPRFVPMDEGGRDPESLMAVVGRLWRRAYSRKQQQHKSWIKNSCAPGHGAFIGRPISSGLLIVFRPTRDRARPFAPRGDSWSPLCTDYETLQNIESNTIRLCWG